MLRTVTCGSGRIWPRCRPPKRGAACPVWSRDRLGDDSDEDEGADAVSGCLCEDAVDDAFWGVGEQDLPVVLETVRAAGCAPVRDTESVFELGCGFGPRYRAKKGVVCRGEGVDSE